MKLKMMWFLFSIKLCVLAKVPIFSSPEFLKLKNGDYLGVDSQFVSGNGKAYSTQGFASPEWADWDNDGLKDLIVGQFNDSKIKFFKNIGTSSNPVFEFPINLESDGAIIKNYYGWCIGASNPQVVDYDNDGLMDLIIGERSKYNGKAGVLFYKRKHDNTLTNMGKLKYLDSRNNLKEVVVTQNSSPRLADLVGDSLLDLVLAEEGKDVYYDEGYIWLYENIGTSISPLFTMPIKLSCNNSPIRHARGQIDIYDLDKDGKKDLIAGDLEGEISFYKNIGTNKTLNFDSRVFLHSENKKIKLPMEKGKVSCQVRICDINNDSIPDILAGNAGSYLYHFKGMKNTTISSKVNCSDFSSVNIVVNNGRIQLNNINELISVSFYSVSGKLFIKQEINKDSIIDLPDSQNSNIVVVVISGEGFLKEFLMYNP